MFERDLYRLRDSAIITAFDVLLDGIRELSPDQKTAIKKVLVEAVREGDRWVEAEDLPALFGSDLAERIRNHVRTAVVPGTGARAG